MEGYQVLQFELAIIGLIQSVAVVIIGGLFARDSKKRKKQLENAEARAILRAEESLLAIKLMSASVNLGTATAQAIKEGATNGAMNAALADAARAEEAYQHFIKEVAVRQIAKNTE